MAERSVNPEPRRAHTRPYSSPARARRAAQTRARIIAAARRLFLEQGYFPTTMRAIADAAGVAEKTVYLAFTNKPTLLDAVIDAALSDATAASEPPLSGPTASAGPPAEVLRAFARSAGAIMDRTARVLAIAEAAATIDPELAELRAHGHNAMRQRFHRVAATLHAQGVLAPLISETYAAATIYALANDSVYLRLTDGYGWSTEDYAHWLATVLIATLTDPEKTRQTPR
jgi:AcrR family transcriptional regulator